MPMKISNAYYGNKKRGESIPSFEATRAKSRAGRLNST